MQNKKIRLAAILGAACLAVAAWAGPAAADPTGTWITQNGDAHVRVTRCGSSLCGTVVWLREPNDPVTGKPVTDQNNADPRKRSRPVLGLRIVIGMRPGATPNKWNGQFYNADDGKSYDGSLMPIDAQHLKAEGCLLVMCSAETWTRLK